MPPAQRLPNQSSKTHPRQPPACARNRFRATLNSSPVARPLIYTATDERTTACESCIIIMNAMRLEKLRQIDLNLVITFAAIAEERSITAAASRLLLSQPAVSRALQRARVMFQDDLLVRSPNGFELTLRGRKILEELEILLPTLDRLVTPDTFDPMREKSHFRISGPDN